MTPQPAAHTALGYFNLAKGLGMVLILLGHSITPFFPEEAAAQVPFAGAGSVLGGGIMAMFFLISGLGFYSRSPKKCLRIQFKTLLRPYYLTAAAILITKVCLALLKRRSFARNGGQLVLTYLLGLNAEGGGRLAGIPIESVSIFWFILALFGGWVLYNAISRLKSERLRLFCVAVCVLTGYLLTLISRVWPYCLPMMLLTAGYLAAGCEIRRRELLDQKLPLWAWAGMLAVMLLCAAFGGVNMVACQWKLGLLDVLGSFCAGFALLRLYHAFMKRGFQGPVIRLLEAVGFHSIWIVCLHGYEKIIFPWYRLEALFPPALAAVVCFLARCVVMYGLFRLVRLVSRPKKRGKPAVTLEF